MVSLDVGCGIWKGSPKGQINLDINKPLFKIPNFVCADANYLPFKNEVFEQVFFFEVIEHLEKPINALQEIFHVLKKGGSVLLSTPNPFHWRNCFMVFRGKEVHGDNPEHAACWFPELLIVLLKKAKFVRFKIDYGMPKVTFHNILDKIAFSVLPKTVGGYLILFEAWKT